MSPIVVKNRVFAGSTSGHIYALDARTGNNLWQFPSVASTPLVTAGFGSYGISAGAAYWYRRPNGAIIFGAPDPSAEGGNGSARLWAVDAKLGTLIWSSDIVAHVSGATKHERIANTGPLIFNNLVYIGIADNGDNPIQNGKVIAVDLSTGHIVSGFSFTATGTRGGGVWNAPAADFSALYFTTGNTRCDAMGCQSPEPSPNHGLSMVRIDPTTGNLAWAFQPVPFSMDDDPDWAAGVTIMSTSCGELAASVQKDGWAYGVPVSSGTPNPGIAGQGWQFPYTDIPFHPGDGTDGEHGDTDYKHAGSAWNDVLAITAGGETLVHGVSIGFGKIHALNACAGEPDRVRWILDVPNNNHGGYSLSSPTVTGGIFYVSTDQGHVVAIADPSIYPAPGWQCTNMDITAASPTWVTDCTSAGYSLVPVPAVLANVSLPDGGDAAGLRNEVAIANGRLFVGTSAGHVYMLATDP